MGETKNQVNGGWSATDPDVVVVESTSVGPTGDPELDALVDDIVYTREEMTGTVEQIGDRLDPKNILSDARDNVREATIGKVEDMATTASDVVSNAGQAAQEAGSGVVDTIRRNPLPAAMIGIGITWLAMSNRGSNSFRSSDWSNGSRFSGEGSWDTVDGGGADYRSGFAGGSVTDRVSQAAGDTVGQVQDKVGRVQDKAGRLADQVQTTAGQLPNKVRPVADNATRAVKENPLAVGAIALAVGAAVGMAIPATKPEREFMGQARDSLIGRAENAASDAMNKVEESARQS